MLGRADRRALVLDPRGDDVAAPDEDRALVELLRYRLDGAQRARLLAPGDQDAAPVLPRGLEDGPHARAKR